MAHKRFRECDGVKYVTNLLRYNTGLIKTVSDAPKRRKAKTIKEANKVKELNRQLKALDKVLKSHKQNKDSEYVQAKENCSVYNYPIIDRRI